MMTMYVKISRWLLLSPLCDAFAGEKTVKQMMEIIKKDKLVGEVRRMQHRLGFVYDRNAELLLKSYIKRANFDPTVFRYTTLAHCNCFNISIKMRNIHFA